MSQINLGMLEINEMSPQEYYEKKGQYVLIDVRTQEEWVDVHAAEATHVPLGPEFEEWVKGADASKSYAFVCHRGGRSDMAARYAKSKGINSVTNVMGGMAAWVAANLPVAPLRP